MSLHCHVRSTASRAQKLLLQSRSRQDDVERESARPMREGKDAGPGHEIADVLHSEVEPTLSHGGDEGRGRVGVEKRSDIDVSSEPGTPPDDHGLRFDPARHLRYARAMTRETVLEERDAGVLLLTLNRPRQRNAFNRQMWHELRDALAAAGDDPAVRAVIVTGAPGAFSAGQDLGEMTGTDEDPGFGSFMDRLCAFDKPLIAAVNGVGVGIGLTLLLHCDVVYIAEGARLRPPFVTLGVVPEAASSYLLPVTIGWQRAAEVLFTADWIDAAQAVTLGIASRLCTPDELLPAARAVAARIAQQPPEAVRHTKRLLMATRSEHVRAARAREDQAFVERIGTAENLEAIAAFFEKRAPDFSKL
jgi:enoyl-CoA hydratase/carnithine racemase